jgi:hypothetical protein
VNPIRLTSLPALAVEVLRREPKVWFCVACWAHAANLPPSGRGELEVFAHSFIGSSDPSANERGVCGRCGVRGMVVNAAPAGR